MLEHKYYADGVGLVLTIDKEAGGREELLIGHPVPCSRRAARRAHTARRAILTSRSMTLHSSAALRASGRCRYRLDVSRAGAR